MEFESSPQTDAFLSAQGKIILNACPGSGKTTAIVKKLSDLQRDYDANYGRYSGIACISFTNTAKDEINQKYFEFNGESLKFPHHVSTIDSFINQFVTLPFYYLLDSTYSRPKIVDDNSFIDDIWRPKLNFKGVDGNPFCFAYPPSSIRFERDGRLSSNGYIPDETKVQASVFENYCKALKAWQLKSGLITTGDSAYIAFQLLLKYPKIGQWLAARFPHIIIDEAQDNSAIQHAIFDKLVEYGVKEITFVGDPYQCLYEWRDSDPKLFLDKFDDSVNWLGLALTGNRRSTQNIIDCFSLIRRQSDPPITAIGVRQNPHPVLIYRYTDDNISHIVSDFDTRCQQFGFQDNQIVVRGNSLKNKMLGKIADQNPWNNGNPYIVIEAVNKFEGKEIKEAVRLIREVYISLKFSGADYHQVKELEQRIKVDPQINGLLLQTLHLVPSFNLSIRDWTTQLQQFFQSQFALVDAPNFDMKSRNSKYFDKRILDEPMNNHFKKSFSAGNIPITTIHQVKGKTLDSILIFFNATNHKENITFLDIENSQDTFPNERQRLIYVAMSRPRHFLAMAFPSKVSAAELSKKFGNEIEIITI